MITFIFLAVFAMIGIAFVVVAYSANQRKRAAQSGIGFIHYQRSQYPRVVPPTT
jgi:cbb3-type cytochrome oxidase subunit 3